MPTVSDVVRLKDRHLVTISPSATVAEAVQAMNANRIGAILVMDGDQVAGIFTERDVMTRIVVPEQCPRKVLVRDVMTTEVVACRLSTDLDDVAALMQSQRIRHLPIIDDDGVPMGMISIGDVNAFNVLHKQATIENLSDYICGRG